MAFGLYGSGSGLLKLDPRTKLLLFCAGIAVSTFSYNECALWMYCAAMCALLALCGEKWFALKCGALIACMEYLRYRIITSGTGAPALTGILVALIMMCRYGFPLLLSLSFLIKTTRISQLIAALSALHLPLFVIIPLSVMLRFIPTVQEEWDGVRKAMAFRGISLEPGAVIRAPFKTIEYILIPLLFSCISVMDELASASLARGLDAERKRTSYETVKMRFPDYIIILLFVGIAFYAAVGGRS
ncbi:energy-coupling factor transporter transmembrane protein EcfT [Treponema vincentii]|jgi:ABC-type cobalt transport system permease component|uniref:Energy-coupling factor transporter transmembrane protein EcfT n=1 Tax=Treponema vincentii TaxID=69710 RepID=A0A6P1Y1D2_9SPIR|nr:energy-coupling factor transporter transmembrane component T [Treponema vincentii]QHX43334.1 energy-coupling factor transporter transmembrane protein EcfT [Treponema vincentii]